MITKEMKIHDILVQNEDAADILISFGMPCLGCSLARGETLEQAANAHGISLDKLLDKLNAQ